MSTTALCLVHKTKLMTLAVGIAITAVLWMGAASAQATTSMSCAFAGTVSVTGVPLIGGTGLFSLQTGAAPEGVSCGGAINGAPMVVLSGVLQSTGTYFNTVCGVLGRFESSGSSTSLRAATKIGPAPDVSAANYSIQFVAGQGELVIDSAQLSNGDVVTGGGWVSMTPTSPLPPALACSAGTPLGFKVAGFLTVLG